MPDEVDNNKALKRGRAPYTFKGGWSEPIACWVLRALTYFVLFAVGVMVIKISWEGLGALTQPTFPFIEFEFFMGVPQTLHVFEHGGEILAMPESEFRKFLLDNGIAPEDLEVVSYPLCAGGILPAIAGSLLLVGGAVLISWPLGVAAAIYLSEYAHQGLAIRILRGAIIQLAGLPSIVFGLFGMAFFVVYLDFGQGLAAGCATLAVFFLPFVIIASEDSLHNVPDQQRDAAYALGATRWQVVRQHVIPNALPGMLRSGLFICARLAGEAAPIMFTAAFAFRDTMPWQVESLREFLGQGVMALPFHLYVLGSKVPVNSFTEPMHYASAFTFLAIVGLFAIFGSWIPYARHRVA